MEFERKTYLLVDLKDDDLVKVGYSSNGSHISLDILNLNGEKVTIRMNALTFKHLRTRLNRLNAAINGHLKTQHLFNEKE